MLKTVDPTIARLVEAASLRERADVSLTISNLPECVTEQIQFNIADGTSTSDLALRIPSGLQISEIRGKIQTENIASLPKVWCYIDNRLFFKHHITFMAKNIAFGSCAYSARGVSDEIYLQELGSVDFNKPPYANIWRAQEMIKTIIGISGAPIIPIFHFEDFEVLHITDFYSIPYIDMIVDVLSGMPISVSYVSDETNTKMYFVDVAHKARFAHKIVGNTATSLSASITYIPPKERNW